MTDKKTWDTSRFKKAVHAFNEDHPIPMHGTAGVVVSPRAAPFLKAVWDDDAGTYFSETNIRGLHIKAATLEDFRKVALEAAPDISFECTTKRL